MDPMPPALELGTAPLPARWPLVGRRHQLDRVAAVLADDAMRGVLVHGPAGVGKTRLADESFEVATAQGRIGGRSAASAGAVGVSLGALIPLLPVEVVEQRFDPAALYATVAAAFRDAAGARPFVLLVDDMHRLDPASVTLLGQLLDANVVFLIGTVRTGDSGAAAMSELWRRDHVLRIDLENLPRDDIDTLLHLALGGPVEAAAGEALWTRSRGNLLFLRELVLGAHSTGRLVAQQGIWRLRGALPNTARLAELVDLRLAEVSADASDLLGLLALREPLGLSALTDLVGQQPLDELDRAALLRVVSGGRRQHVSLAHPLYSEVVRERLAPLTRRRLLLVYADRIEGFGARRREDALRVANARLDAEGVADHALVLAAARLARYGHDYPQVERLARAALVEQVSPEALLLLAEALHELGAYADAEAVLVRHEAVIAGADETDRVRLVAIRVRNLMWGLDRADEALAVNRATCADISDDEGRAELVADEAMVLAFGGHPADALAVLDAHEPGGPRARVLRSIAEVPALILTGRCETARVLARRAFREHEALGDQLAIAHPGIHVIQEVYALMDSGRIEDAWQLASAAFPIATRVGAPLGRIWFAFGLGRSAWLAGRLETARRWLAESAGLCSDYGFDGPRRIALSLLATSAAQLGDVAGCDAAVDELDRLRSFAYRAPEQELGRAWAAVAHGEQQRGRDLLLAAADRAAATGERAIEVVLLHDVARLGEPAAVRERIEAVAAECEGRPRAGLRRARACARRSESLGARGGCRRIRRHRGATVRRRGRDRGRAGLPATRRRPHGNRDGREGNRARATLRRCPDAGSPRRGDSGTAHGTGTRDRDPRGRAVAEQRDRRPLVALGANGEQPPAAHLREARRHEPDGARGRARRV